MAALIVIIALTCMILGLANSIPRKFNPFLPTFLAFLFGLAPS